MEKMKLNKNQTLGIFAAVLIVLSQACEKILEVVITPSQTTALVCAMVYTIVVAVVFLIVTKLESPFLGIFASMLAVKMLPPNITYIASVTADGAMLYFILSKVVFVLFALLALRFYRVQKNDEEHIRAVPIIILFYAVPFFNQIEAFTSAYFMEKTGSMLLPFLTQYACYAAASIIILAVAFKCGKASMRFASYFEFCAFGINIFRQLGKICYFAATGQHISKSLFGWIIVLAGLIVINAIMLNKSKKSVE